MRLRERPVAGWEVLSVFSLGQGVKKTTFAPVWSLWLSSLGKPGGSRSHDDTWPAWLETLGLGSVASVYKGRPCCRGLFRVEIGPSGCPERAP